MFPGLLINQVLGEGPPRGCTNVSNDFYLFTRIIKDASIANKKMIHIRIDNPEPVWSDQNTITALNDFLYIGGELHLCIHNALTKQGALKALKETRLRFWDFLKKNQKRVKNGQLKLSWWIGDEYSYRPHLIISSKDVCVIIRSIGDFYFNNPNEVNFWTKVFQETPKEGLSL